MRSDWSAMNFDTCEFHVTGEAIKRDKLHGRGIPERYVQVPETAMRLLTRGQTGRIVPMGIRAFSKRIAQMKEILGLDTWPHDCLRHSAGTYMLAEKGDGAWVANWMGHTNIKMLMRNYARAVPKAVAVEWWALKP